MFLQKTYHFDKELYYIHNCNEGIDDFSEFHFQDFSKTDKDFKSLFWVAAPSVLTNKDW